MTASAVQSVPFLGLLPAEVEAEVASLGWAKFRAQQLLDWVYRKGVTDPAEMTNLSKLDRQNWRDDFRFGSGTVADATEQQRRDDQAAADVGGWEQRRDGDDSRHGDRRTACVSSQVGCPVGCKFCASGVGGVKGILTAGQNRGADLCA